MPEGKRDTLLVMSVALAVTLAGVFGGVLYLGMENARPGEGFHYNFDPARATLKASSYFAYLEKEGSPATAKAAGLARKLLPFLGPAPRAAWPGRAADTSYSRPPARPAPPPGYGGGKDKEDHPDWDSVYTPPFSPASRRPGYSPGYGGGYGVSRTAASPRGLNDSSEPPDVNGAARRGSGELPPPAAAAGPRQEPAQAGASRPGARQTGNGGEKQYVPAGYGQRGEARAPGIPADNTRGQVPGAGPLSGGLEAMSARSARSYTAKVSGGVGGGASTSIPASSSGGVPKASAVSATSAKPYSAVSGVMTSVVTDKLNGRENPAVNQAEAATTPPSTLTKPGGVTPSSASQASSSSSGAQPAQQADSPQTTQPGADPEDPAKLSAARVKELQGEIETSLRQIENAYGPMSDMYYKSCDNSALCAEHGLKGGYVTMTTTLDARIELGLKYVQKKWERYTISFDPGRAFSAKDDGEEGE